MASRVAQALHCIPNKLNICLPGDRRNKGSAVSVWQSPSTFRDGETKALPYKAGRGENICSTDATWYRCPLKLQKRPITHAWGGRGKFRGKTLHYKLQPLFQHISWLDATLMALGRLLRENLSVQRNYATAIAYFGTRNYHMFHMCVTTLMAAGWQFTHTKMLLPGKLYPP